MVDFRQIDGATWARFIVLVVALFNQVLTMTGLNPLPFSEEQIYEGLTAVFTVLATLVAWWKDNDIKKETIEKKRKAGLK